MVTTTDKPITCTCMQGNNYHVEEIFNIPAACKFISIYMYDDLCQKLETIIILVKGVK